MVSRPTSKESELSARSSASSVFSIEEENEDYAFADEILPDGWRRYFDDLTGQWYFVELNTQKSTWIKPGEEETFLPSITRAPKLKKDVPKTYITSATQVPDPKLMTVAEVPSIGPAYPDRQSSLTREVREQFGIPSVPIRCSKDQSQTYLPYEPKSNTIKVNTRWVNLAPPVPLVPVHRPVWDDREFWSLCSGDAEVAQLYNDFWIACYYGEIEQIEYYLSIEKLDHAASIPIGWSTKNNQQLRGSTPIHLAIEGNHYDIVKLLLSKPMIKWGISLAKPSSEELQLQHHFNSLGGGSKKHKRNSKNNMIFKNSLTQSSNGGSSGLNHSSGHLYSSNTVVDREMSSGGGEGMNSNKKPKTPLNILVKDSNGMTPLLSAIQKGNYKIVNALMKHDRTYYHINECRDCRGAAALHYACQGGHLQIAQLLHSKGKANLVSRDNRGITPLLLAERNGHSNIVAWLLSQEGVPWDDVDDHGMSLLMVACEKGDVGLVRDLCFIARIINSESREPIDPDDPTTFPVVKKKGKYATGRRRKVEDEIKTLPPHAIACYLEPEVTKKNKEEEVRESPNDALARAEAILAKMKAEQEGSKTDNNDDDDDNDSISSHVHEKNKNKKIDKLKEEEEKEKIKIEEENRRKGISTSINATSSDENHILAYVHNLPRLLVPKHQRVWLDRKDKSGRTPLVIATLHGHIRVVELLLAQKGRCGKFGRQVWLCDENARNGSSLGTRPVDVAREKGHRSLQFYLIQVCKDRAEEEKGRRKQLVHGGGGKDGEPSPERKTIPL